MALISNYRVLLALKEALRRSSALKKKLLRRSMRELRGMFRTDLAGFGASNSELKRTENAVLHWLISFSTFIETEGSKENI